MSETTTNHGITHSVTGDEANTIGDSMEAFADWVDAHVVVRNAGPIADRPAADGTNGAYWSTDEGTPRPVYVDVGSTWVCLNRGDRILRPAEAVKVVKSDGTQIGEFRGDTGGVSGAVTQINATTGSDVATVVASTDGGTPSVYVLVDGAFGLKFLSVLNENGTSDFLIASAASANRTALGVIAPSVTTAYHGTTQSAGNNTFTPLVFNAERVDTDGLHSTVTNTGRITLTAGTWEVSAHCQLPAATAGTNCVLRVMLNGSEIQRDTRPTLGASYVIDLSVLIPARPFSAADYLTCEVFQLSGGAVLVTAGAELSAKRVA